MKSAQKFFIRILLCLAVMGMFLYFYMQSQNELTALQLAIPIATKELKAIREENIYLQYLVDEFESPAHLMELARKDEFAHFKPTYSTFSVNSRCPDP